MLSNDVVRCVYLGVYPVSVLRNSICVAYLVAGIVYSKPSVILALKVTKIHVCHSSYIYTFSSGANQL